MGRPLTILAATLAVLAVLSLVLSFVHVAQQPGSAGDAALWRTTAIALFVAALVAALASTLTALFEQAERRHEEQEQQRRALRRAKKD